jgi:hypothetical protein
MKSFPETVRVISGPPVITEAGEMLVRIGTGLPVGLMVKARAPDVPPPGVGLKTVTDAVPAAAISDARMAAVSLVAEI